MGALLPVFYFLAIPFPPPKQRARSFFGTESLGLLREPVFLFAGLALAVQSGMEGMSNDWTTRYFKTVVLAATNTRADTEFKTLFGLMALTGAMVVARAGAGVIAETRRLRRRAFCQHGRHGGRSAPLEIWNGLRVGAGGGVVDWMRLGGVFSSGVGPHRRSVIRKGPARPSAWCLWWRCSAT